MSRDASTPEPANRQPEPDTKDWTWTIERRCPECGTDVSAMSPQDVAAELRACLPRWAQVLRREAVAVRPAPTVWSALEYAAHVRDVFKVMHYRLDLMLMEEDPAFPDWDQDATALEDNYAGQSPQVVATQLAAAGRGLADAFDAVLNRDLHRRGLRGNGSEFTVQTLARYAWHDVAHHLHDVGA
ncbi:DinB family protein [Arthrobacter sp.]|uniref:DinB family protein n=1 Tax=Arthrobacter sp. TaxID=1667 RepID=UPI003A95DDB1